MIKPCSVFLSTPSARRATPAVETLLCVAPISIHALREEGDSAAVTTILSIIQFLSTPSARRATCGRRKLPSRERYFYPRPPRGGRRLPGGIREELSDFYPRPPRGGRQKSTLSTEFDRNFYPRPPRGGRLRAGGAAAADEKISIHALREEGDGSGDRCTVCGWYFYPRPPRGGRPGLP